MERVITVKEAESLFEKNFVGPSEVNQLLTVLKLPAISQSEVPPIPYTKVEMENYSRDYILILGLKQRGSQNLSIRYFRDKFGVDPDKKEPCLYNQDWYLSEDFIDRTLDNKWYLIKKEVISESRAVVPQQMIQEWNLQFPSAILCLYTFFSYYYARKDFLWWHDFVWCSDTDHNGDRIYVGKYHDVDGVNKNGFSIHRHLSLRPCYAAIDIR